MTSVSSVLIKLTEFKRKRLELPIQSGSHTSKLQINYNTILNIKTLTVYS